MKLTEIFKQLYFKSTGYSYTNLGRLFLRLFVGIMLLQFGVRHIVRFEDIAAIFPSVIGLSAEASLTLMIVIEIATSIFIMFGFLTRLMTLPPCIAMIMAEYHLLMHPQTGDLFSWMSPAYLPVMFIGIYFFIMLVGPGKISVDYFLSLHMLHSDNKNEEDLEEV
ncbi:MAG: DoxX family protein [Muribaculum sp.]|nr:DoxX family protein [Muribaculum sp.]